MENTKEKKFVNAHGSYQIIEIIVMLGIVQEIWYIFVLCDRLMFLVITVMFSYLVVSNLSRDKGASLERLGKSL